MVGHEESPSNITANQSGQIRMFSVSGILIQIGLIVVLFLGISIILEVGTRLFLEVPILTEKIEQQNAPLTYHPWASRRMPPGFGDEHFSINKYGWRGDDFTKTKPPGTYRVILLGDSVAFSGYQINDEATIAGYIKRILEATTGEKLEVLNMAVAGGNGSVSLATLAHEGIHFQPDVVVALNGQNDLFILRGQAKNIGQKPFLYVRWDQTHRQMNRLLDPRRGRGMPSENLKVILNESAFIRWFTSKIRPESGGWWPTEITHPERLDFFIESQVATYYLAKGAGAKYIHFIQPYLSLKRQRMSPSIMEAIDIATSEKGENFLEFLDAAYPILQAKMAEASQEHGFRSVDMSYMLANDDFFGDQVHVKSESPEKSIANCLIAKKMAEEILLELEVYIEVTYQCDN